MDNFFVFIEENTKRLASDEQKLIAADRKDEANLVRISQNVYGIAKSMYEVAIKLSPDDVKGEMLKRLNGILATWEANHVKVKEHNDIEKIVVEETKIGTLHEILKWIDAAE